MDAALKKTALLGVSLCFDPSCPNTEPFELTKSSLDLESTVPGSQKIRSSWEEARLYDKNVRHHPSKVAQPRRLTGQTKKDPRDQ